MSNHLSQEKLAKLTGMSQSYISDIENGIKIPHLHTINKIACALKINPFTLLDLVTDDIKILLLFLILFL